MTKNENHNEWQMLIRIVRVFPLLACLAAGLALSGCGIGLEGEDDVRAQQARDSKALKDQYSQVTGTYEGILQNSETGLQPLPCTLIVYTLDVADGVNPDGSQRMRPSLRARFRPNEVITETDSLTLMGDYDKMGTLAMTSLTGAAGGGGGAGGGSGEAFFLTMKGSAGNNEVSVQLTRRGGVWGLFKAKRVSLDAYAPAGGDDAEYRERLLKVFRKVEGTYTGIVEETSGKRYKVWIFLTIGETQVGAQGVSFPRLVGQFRYDAFDPGIGEKHLAVDFNSQNNEITMTAVSGGGVIPGSQFMTITGTLVNRVMDVELRNKNGKIGDLHAPAVN